MNKSIMPHASFFKSVPSGLMKTVIPRKQTALNRTYKKSQNNNNNYIFLYMYIKYNYYIIHTYTNNNNNYYYTVFRNAVSTFSVGGGDFETA